MLKDVLFQAIPRCGSLSIIDAFKSYGLRTYCTPEEMRDFDNHGWTALVNMPIDRCLKNGIIGYRYNRDAFKFAFVRHPYSRFASLFAHHTRIHGLFYDMGMLEFAEYVKDRREDFKTLPLRCGEIHRVAPQSRWLYNSAGKQLFNGLGYIERDDTWSALCLTLQVKQYPLLLLNNDDSANDALRYMDTDVLRIVRNVYEEDFDHFKFTR